MKILEELKQRAKNKDNVIILPEANLDERVKLAALEILKKILQKKLKIIFHYFTKSLAMKN